MPGELFIHRPGTRTRATRGGTVAFSIVLHASALFAIIAAQLAVASAGPDVASRLPAFVAADVPRPPEPPPPAAPAATRPRLPVSVTAAPLTAPDHIDLSPPTVPASGTGLPALDVGAPGGVWDGSGQRQVALAPPPVPDRPIPVGGDIRPPARVGYVPPAYPELARRARVDGTVILEATIDPTGAVRNVRVLRSIPLLDGAAVEALSQWRYTPTLLNGTPVSVLMTVTVRFTLR